VNFTVPLVTADEEPLGTDRRYSTVCPTLTGPDGLPVSVRAMVRLSGGYGAGLCWGSPMTGSALVTGPFAGPPVGTGEQVRTAT
jgi:hypothetical protein